MKTLTIFCFCVFISCTPKNLLLYKDIPYHKESNTYQLYSNTIILRQSISYNRIMVMDEEYAFGLGITLNEEYVKNGKRLFDINDSSLSYFHQIPKRSLLESKKYKLAGSFEILKLDSTRIVLKEKIKVLDSSSNVIAKYRGKKRFNRNYKDWKLYFD